MIGAVTSSVEKIRVNRYGGSGKIINSGDVYVDYSNETIQFPSGKVFKVVPDGKYTFKFLKKQIKAVDGIKGYVKFIKEINKADSPFNTSYTRQILEM
jgi:hypothetical protein